MRRIAATILGFLAVCFVLTAWLNYDRPDISTLLPATVSKTTVNDTQNGLHVTFLGTSTVLLDDGETQLLTDGFFTRPSLLSLLGEISPDRQVVEDALLQYGINETLAAVIPVHSHHDHALDSALVAQLTGATLLGSESSAMLARGEGLDKRQIRVAETKQPYQFGNFSVTLIESGHVPMPNAIAGWIGLGEDIEKPVSPPAKLGDYHQESPTAS